MNELLSELRRMSRYFNDDEFEEVSQMLRKAADEIESLQKQNEKQAKRIKFLSIGLSRVSMLLS